MTKKNDGGQVFPLAIGDLDNHDILEGMTLRQWYAGMSTYEDLILPETIKECAIFIGVSTEEYNGLIHWPKVVAKARFLHAQAMLEAEESDDS